MTTAYHARYGALELRRRGVSGEVEALGSALFDARVDLNPHQIEAALFGLLATADSGRLLADEVGLGKTIEAALVLCQRWAERRRRLLVVCPAAIRKQWCSELESKFGLPVRLVERRSDENPFDVPGVAVASYPYAARRSAELAAVPWDLVVFDEAHRLRNAWKSESRQAATLVSALAAAPKLFLTATPLQNSLLELYGLVSVLDPHVFGDVDSFKARFVKGRPDLGALRERLRGVANRTLRRSVLPYIQYTNRRSLTERFRSSPEERRLYAAVSELVARDDLLCLPRAQRALVTMMLRKLLASSSAAIASMLGTLRDRLAREQEGSSPEDAPEASFEDEGLDPEWADVVEEVAATPDEPSDPECAAREIAELDSLVSLARSIGTDQRMRALVRGLRAGFRALRDRGAPEKAVLFTESRQTQQALRGYLEANGYEGRIVTFNGTNEDPYSRAVLDAWLAHNPERAAGSSRAANMRLALVERFRDEATLLIATEAGAEGLNLQFCAFVVNYDLPWNPQRVEQRIGRCHRYGQRHDVVVLNFLDESNRAEQRVLELLTDKFQLFDGVFGASDEVLGAVDGGAGFEARVHRIFQSCRTPEAIEAAFTALRAELEETIREREQRARRALLDHFDEDVHERLRVRLDEARAHMDRVTRLFWSVTRWVLDGHATFDEAHGRFHLDRPPLPGVARGTYELVSRGGNEVSDAFVYRMTHPLGDHVLEAAACAPTPIARLDFDVSSHPTRIAVVESLRDRSGWLRLERLRVSGHATEDHLLFSGQLDDGSSLDAETAERLFAVAADVAPAEPPPPEVARVLDDAAARLRGARIAQAAARHERELARIREQLERWADDQIHAAEVAVKELRAELKALERRAREAPTLDEQRALQAAILSVEERQRAARRRVFSVEDEVRARRRELLDRIEQQIAQRSEHEPVFTVAFTVV